MKVFPKLTAIATFLLFTIAIPNFLYSQLQYVPKNASIVIVIDLNKLGQKMDLNNIKNYSFLKPEESVPHNLFNRLLKVVLNNPTESGIDLTGKIILFKNADSFNSLNILFPLKNKNLFEKKMVEFNKSIENPSDDYHISEIEREFGNKLIEIKNKNGKYFVNSNSRLGIGIYKNLSWVTEGPYFYADESYYREYRRLKDSVQYLADSIAYGHSRNDYIEAPSDISPAPQYEDNVPPIEYPVVDSAAPESPPEYQMIEDYSDVDYYSETSVASTTYTDSIMQAFEDWWEKEKSKRSRLNYLAHNQKYINTIHYYYSNNNSTWARKDVVVSELNKNSDVFFWFNHSHYFNQYNLITSIFNERYWSDEENSNNYPIEYNKDSTPLAKYIKDLGYIGHGNFNSGNLNLDFQLMSSEAYKNDFKKFIGNGIPKELTDVIKSDSVLGIFSYSIKFNGMMKNIYDVFHYAYESRNPNFRTRKEALMGFDFFYLFLDKKVVEETLSGDFIAAFTGKKTYEKTYKDYVQDEEYNYKEVEVTKNVDIPLFVFAADLNIKENIQYIIDIFVNTGYLTAIDNGVYKISYEGKEIKDSAISMLTFIVENNTLIITNEVKYRNAAFRNSPGKLDPALATKLSSNMSYMTWNATNTFNLFKSSDSQTPSTIDKAAKMSKSINLIEMRSFMSESDRLNSNINIRFIDTNTNGLVQFLDFTELLLSQ